MPAVPTAPSMSDRGMMSPAAPASMDDDKTVPIVDVRKAGTDDAQLLLGSPINAMDREAMNRARKSAGPVVTQSRGGRASAPTSAETGGSASDMTGAFAGGVIAVIGILLLGVFDNEAARFAGLFFPSGVLTSLFILAFSNLGRQATQASRWCPVPLWAW